jgi:hypothetical protein
MSKVDRTRITHVAVAVAAAATPMLSTRLRAIAKVFRSVKSRNAKNARREDEEDYLKPETFEENQAAAADDPDDEGQPGHTSAEPGRRGVKPKE